MSNDKAMADAARRDVVSHAPERERFERTDPDMILADETVSREQKLRFLQEWRAELASHDSSGTAPTSGLKQAGDEGGNAALIARIEAVLAQLARAG